MWTAKEPLLGSSVKVPNPSTPLKMNAVEGEREEITNNQSVAFCGRQ